MPPKKASAKILKKNIVFRSPWITLIEKTVDFGFGEPQGYFSIEQGEYLAIVARTPAGRFPLVRQYRPAVECETLELPAGLLEKGESPAKACERELLEETGHRTTHLHSLGSYFPDTGRLCNLIHVFFAEIEENPVHSEVEQGISVEYHTQEQMDELVRKHSFRHQLHLSAYLLFRFLNLSSTK